MSRGRAAFLTVVVGFVLALGAGVVVGFAVAGHRPAAGPIGSTPVPPATLSSGRRDWLADQLGLDATQRERVRVIWSESMRAAGQQNADRSRALKKERDDAIQAMLSDAQKAQYQKVMQDYAAKVAEAGHERDKAFEDAINRTKLVLNESQRQQYEQLLKERREREKADHSHPGHGPGDRSWDGRGNRRSNGHGPDSRPSFGPDGAPSPLGMSPLSPGMGLVPPGMGPVTPGVVPGLGMPPGFAPAGADTRPAPF